MSQTALVTLTSSEILNLRTTPIQILAAPGSGMYYIPFSVILRLHAGSNAYSNLTTALSLIINNINILPADLPSTIVAASNDSFAYYCFTNYSSNALNLSNFNNQAVYIKNTGLLNFASGNGTLDVITTYEIFSI